MSAQSRPVHEQADHLPSTVESGAADAGGLLGWAPPGRKKKVHLAAPGGSVIDQLPGEAPSLG